MLEIIPNLHPLAVHFPIALTALAAIFLLLARIHRASASAAQWASVGHWALWLAALSAVLAAAFGWQAYGAVRHDEAGHLAMTLHRNWALPTTLALLIIAAVDRWRCPADRPAAWPTIVGTVFLLGAVGVTGWLGGELVYRHGIGVLSLPREPASEAAEEQRLPAADGAAPKAAKPAAHAHAADGHNHRH